GLAFAVAAGMWWIYFDITASSSQRELAEAEEEAEDVATDQRHDLFVYGHLPLTLGIVLAGVGLEELAVHPEVGAPSAAAWVLASGVATFLVGVALVIGGTTRTLRAVWPWPMAGIPLVLAGALVPFPGALLLTGAYAVAVLALAAHGTVASRRSDTVLAGAD
ncbi:MAG: low temperature requirement protein A, partial [Actinomycetes bacterium]